MSALVQEISSFEEIENLINNKIILKDPDTFSMEESMISFSGENNILVCDKNVSLENCRLQFNGNNSIIFLSESTHKYRLSATMYNNSVFYVGKDVFFNGVLTLICSEGKHVFIGDKCLFAFSIWIRTADPHLIYSSKTNKRINDSKSVFIGDHVWIGQNVIILKDTRIHSGTILAAGSVVGGKRLPSNTVWGGNPVKEIRKDIFWDETVVHNWMPKQTEKNKEFQKEENFLFQSNEEEYVSFDSLDKGFNGTKAAEEKLEFLYSIYDNTNHDRFGYIPPPPPVPEPPKLTVRRRIKLFLKKIILRILR